MKNPWKKLGSKVVYKNPWIKVREDKVIRPDGKKGIYGVIETVRSAAIIPIENGNVYLVEQYRYPIKKWSLEVCTGGNSGHEKDSIFTIAKTELKEELGFTAKKWTKIAKWYPFNGVIDEVCYLYVAEDLKYVGNCPEGVECLRTKKVSLKEFGELVESGKIDDAFSIISFYKLKEYIKL